MLIGSPAAVDKFARRSTSAVSTELWFQVRFLPSSGPFDRLPIHTSSTVCPMCGTSVFQPRVFVSSAANAVAEGSSPCVK